ncbi:hypothetical protein [Rheinheimera pacifica]|uniref:hypothetical protein n=1 Tax=Rheinheimera pacifica TaxID=173990 RepID=UPI002ED9F08E
MVKVHIWLRDEKHVGHTALTIRDVYVSFWPDGEAGKKDLKIKTSHPGAYVESLEHDIENEGGRKPITIDIANLDEVPMLHYVNFLQNNVPRYQIARHNCSHLVVDVLKRGANKKPSFKPNAAEYAKVGRILGYGIWTPANVMRYANELKSA